jgi:hypothetical protein
MGLSEDEARAIIERLNRDGVSVEPDENEPGANRSWLRWLVWVAVALVCFAAYRIVRSALSGLYAEIRESNPLHLLGFLSKAAFFGVLPVFALVNSVKLYMASRDWRAWFQFGAVLCLYAGGWAWVGYFYDQGAFLIIWPLIVAVVFFALLWVHDLAVQKMAQTIVDINTAPTAPPGPTTGKADPRNMGDW